MTEAHETEMKMRAWVLAHKLISMAPIVPPREHADLLVVTTQALCDAMGQPTGARLEEVQAFARDVVAFMKGFGIFVSCGCGYLSLRVTGEETAARFLEADREPVEYRPGDLDACFRKHVLLDSSVEDTLPQTCETGRVRETLHKV